MKSHIFSFSKFRNSLLNEAINVEDWYNKFQQSFGNITLQIVKDIVKADPTSKEGTIKGLYSQWLINLYKANNLKLEDLYKATEYLTIFDLKPVKAKLTLKDINQYKSLPDLFKAIEPYQSKKSQLSKRELDDFKMIDDEIELFYEDEFIKVIIPLTERGSCYLGKNTQWCTAVMGNNAENKYNNYTKDGSKLYIIFDKEDDERYQFSFGAAEFMYESNARIDDFFFLKNSPEFLQKLGKAENEKFHLLVECLMENFTTSNVDVIKQCGGILTPIMLTYLLQKLLHNIREILNKNQWKVLPKDRIFNLIDFFIKDGADINYFDIIKNTNKNKRTYENPIISTLLNPLLVDYLEKFLEYKPDINIKYGKQEKTPLMEISEKRNIKVAEILLKAGADPNLKDAKGHDSGFITIRSYNTIANTGFINYILLLKQYGWNIKNTNNQGLNIIDFYTGLFTGAQKLRDFIRLKELYEQEN